jgi:hypothetical protein
MPLPAHLTTLEHVDRFDIDVAAEPGLCATRALRGNQQPVRCLP